jgi:tetratricopeptide (TPR) repeat protein
MLPASLIGQTDEVSQVTGMPIPIGAPLLYGQVSIRNIPRDQRRPTIDVILRVGGAQIDKYRANDRGYWYFLRRPVDGQMLAFEVDGAELGQVVVSGGISNRFRQDVEFDWNALRGASQMGTRVISVRDRYQRSADATKAFEKALSAVQGNSEEALQLFNEIVKQDEKDFNAWLQIGILHYNAKRFEAARISYAKAISLNTEYFLAHLNSGKLELSQKNYEGAVAEFTKALAIDANSSDANYLLGESYLQNKKGSLAVGYLNKAIEIDPVGKADAHLRLATLYNAAGYKDRAALEYKAFLDKVKDYPDRKRLEQYIRDNHPKN